MKIRRRHVTIAGAVATAAAVVVAVTRPAAVPVDIATVDTGYLRVTVDEEGITRVRQRYVIAAPVTGRLNRIALDEGDSVRSGEVLLRISPVPLDVRTEAQAQARVEAAEAIQREARSSVELATANLEEAVRQLARAESLAVNGLIAVEQRDLARLSARTSEKHVEAARSRLEATAFEVEAARAPLLAASPSGTQPSQECVEIRSPIDGRVLRVREENERVVPYGTPLVEIGDPTQLEIVVDVLSTDAVRVVPGTRLLVEDWGGDVTLEAVVRLVEPSGFTKVSALGVEEQRVNVIADFIHPPMGIGDGFRVETRTVLWESEAVLGVPWSALVRRGAGWGVYVLDDGRTRWRDVVVGHRGAAIAEIENGLASGDRVVVHPSDDVHDGGRAAVQREVQIDRR
jgi:HlyD family secretion protein